MHVLLVVFLLDLMITLEHEGKGRGFPIQLGFQKVWSSCNSSLRTAAALRVKPIKYYHTYIH